MQFEYTVELLSMEEIGGLGAVAEAASKIVYACAEDGECTVRDLGKEQLEHLQGYMNQMGQDGWEMVQLFLVRNGVVIFWKRQLVPEE